MAMVVCPKCKRRVNSWGRVCPKCEHRIPKSEEVGDFKTGSKVLVHGTTPAVIVREGRRQVDNEGKQFGPRRVWVQIGEAGMLDCVDEYDIMPAETVKA